MAEEDLLAFGKGQKFLRLFVLKESHDLQVVYYLPKRLGLPGPRDGSKPARVPVAVRSEKLPVLLPSLE